MIALILEFLGEFLIQIVGELIIDAVFHGVSRVPWANKILSTVLLVMYFGLGLLLGWISLWFFPQAFTRSATLPGISLLITPLLAGLVMAAIGYIRKREGKLATRIESFLYGFIFAFGMALIRFFFTE